MKLIFLKNNKLIISIWFIITLIGTLKQYIVGQKALLINDFLNSKINNYLIFKSVFYNTLAEKNLYNSYPNSYFDHNHYGPIFSLFIAPFALLPDYIGIVLWNFLNAALLLYAYNKLPLQKNYIPLISWICLNEFITSMLGQQFNPIMTSIIVLSYCYIVEEKEGKAAFLIVLGTFIKLYGIVGLAFFFFSKNKIKFIGYLVLWSIVLFVAPMILASPQFIFQSYFDWFDRLSVKNTENVALSNMQDISIMGMFRKIFDLPNLSNLLFIIPGITLFGSTYLKIKFYTEKRFQLLLLASVLIFTVIFSTGAESPTYIIAFSGVAIWFFSKRSWSKWDYFLLIFALLLTSFSATDLFPKMVRETFIKPYALKALPCVIIWFQIIFEMLTFTNSNQNFEKIK